MRRVGGRVGLWNEESWNLWDRERGFWYSESWTSGTGGSSILFNALFGMHRDSGNKEAVWKFIEFISSEENARIKSLTADRMLSIYNTDMKNGVDVRSFYKLAPKPAANTSQLELDAKVYVDFQMQLNRMVREIMDQLAAGAASTSGMLAEIQQQAQHQLDKLYKQHQE